MNCAIAVLKRLRDQYDFPFDSVILNCEQLLKQNEMNFYDLVCACNKVKKCVGVGSIRLIKATPYIAYISFFKKGHYVLVEKVDHHVLLFDNHFGERKVNKWLFWLVWSKKAIVFIE